MKVQVANFQTDGYITQKCPGTSGDVTAPWKLWAKSHADLQDNVFFSCRATPYLQNISSKSVFAFQAVKWYRLKTP